MESPQLVLEVKRWLHSALAYRSPKPEAELPRSQARDPIPWKWTSKGPRSNLEGGTTRGGRSKGEARCRNQLFEVAA